MRSGRLETESHHRIRAVESDVVKRASSDGGIVAVEGRVGDKPADVEGTKDFLKTLENLNKERLLFRRGRARGGNSNGQPSHRGRGKSVGSW